MEQLNDFAWDNSTESIDFFGEVEYNPNKTSTKEGEESLEELEKDPKEKEKEKEEGQSEEESDVFKDIEVVEKEEEESEEEPEDKSRKEKVVKQELNNVGVASFLKEKGFLNFELEEGEELDDDKASTLIEEKFESSVEEKVNDLIKDLPDSVKNLIKFVSNGGSENEYFSSMQNKGATTISKDLDLEDEKNQELVVRYKLQAQGEDEEDINTQIEFLKEKGKLEDTANKHFNKIIEDLDKEAEALVERQKKAKKEAKENQIKFKKEISTILEEKKEIKNLKFSDQDKKELPDYISNQSVELNDGRSITPFYHDLFETLKDKDKTLLLAKLIKSDFDFSQIEKQAKTKQAKEVEDNLQRNQTSVSKGSSQPKRLTDYF